MIILKLGKMYPFTRLVFLLAFFVTLPPANAQTTLSAVDTNFSWKNIESGFDFGRYQLGDESWVIRPEVFLLRFKPSKFRFHIIRALDLNRQAADVRSMTKSVSGIAGINANFFDENGHALGLIISQGKVEQPLQRGGKLLSGVFYLRASSPAIVHRDKFSASNVDLAIQAGPRLVEDGAAIPIASSRDESSRRSGIAILKNGDIIIFATLLRFPGATLRDIQQMLLDPTLNVASALNLDGGGSSQLFMESLANQQEETLISGGDDVPVALVVSRARRKMWQ